MITKKGLLLKLKNALIGSFFVVLGLLGSLSVTTLNTAPVYADEEETTTTEVTEHKGDSCKDSLGALGWLVCPTTGKISEAVDWLYEKIEGILTISPTPAKDGSPIYEVWKYIKGMTNVAFIIFLLVVIYSQITGLGINNYGIKKALPKLIVAAVLVNLSFLICQLAVDVSNIVGNGLRGIFTSVAEAVIPEGGTSHVAFAEMYTAIAGGAALTIGALVIAFETGAIWMLIPMALGALVAVVSGLVTVALRQAVVALLIMISPLAMVTNILPNTEQWFKKWKDLFFKMLIFYPMFSLLFGASQLAGFAIIASAKDGFGVLLGTAVQIFPLFFSWSLMKMSGTFLGGINAKLNSLASGSLARNRAWADSHRQQTGAYYKQYGRTPFSHLRRYLDNRKNLRETTTTSLHTLRQNDANIYAQKRISGRWYDKKDGKWRWYDGANAQGTSDYLKPTKYTRIAKDLSNSNLASETATMDATHVISNYGSYFVSESTRNKIAAANKIGDKNQRNARLESIKRMDAEHRRSEIGARNYLEYSRAQMTKENDEEADFNFMVRSYLDASMNYDPNKKDTDEYRKYRHFIASSAGGLGETGQTRVLGKIIAKAAAVESNQRRDINIIANKFPPDKRNFRNFLFNYFIDDDGYAIDKDGNRIEDIRDYLRVNDPSKLVAWDKVETIDGEEVPYFDWYDGEKFVTRIYKTDKSAIKELISNFDAPINDPINNMLAIHSGIKPDKDSEIPVLRNLGLDAYRTTNGRAMIGFKEKNAAMSPMVAEMIKKGYIQNYGQLCTAYLDSLNKATKPGAFNTQDSDAIDMFMMMMDPDKWEEIFPTEQIREYRNVNGEPIYGIRFDENGNKVKVPAEEATREELMERMKEKYIRPAGQKIASMMSRQTQNTIDNQKPGTAEKWKKLKEVFDEKWGEDSVVGVDPYKQDGDTRELSSEIRGALYTVDADGTRHSFSGHARNNRRGMNPDFGGGGIHVNHGAQIYEIYNSSLDADDFVTQVSAYCSKFRELVWVSNQIQDFVVDEGYGVTKEQIYEYISEELLPYVNYD